MSIDLANLRLRPFQSSDHDYDALIAIDTAAWPGEPASKEWKQHDDATWDKQYFFERLMVEHDGNPIAYAQASETPWAYEPHKYFVKIMVIPSYQGQGVGHWLYDILFQRLAARGATLLTATTREDQAQAITFLQRRGFVQMIRELESRLDVEAFNRAQFASQLAAVKQQGIDILSIAELQAQDTDWLQKWWTLRWHVIPDVPTSEDFTQESLAEFAASLDAPEIDLNGIFVALDRATGEWAGISGVLIYPDEPETLYVGLTGVIRAYRRRNIALALKVYTIDFAQAYGALEIIGENEENNPMYALNRKLGFDYSHGWLGYEKAL